MRHYFIVFRVLALLYVFSAITFAAPATHHYSRRTLASSGTLQAEALDRRGFGWKNVKKLWPGKNQDKGHSETSLSRTSSIVPLLEQDKGGESSKGPSTQMLPPPENEVANWEKQHISTCPSCQREAQLTAEHAKHFKKVAASQREAELRRQLKKTGLL